MGQHWVAQALGLCSPTNVTAPRRLWQRWKSTVGDLQFRLLYQIYRPWLVNILQNVYWLNDRSIDQSINRWINQSINQSTRRDNFLHRHSMCSETCRDSYPPTAYMHNSGEIYVRRTKLHKRWNPTIRPTTMYNPMVKRRRPHVRPLRLSPTSVHLLPTLSLWETATRNGPWSDRQRSKFVGIISLIHIHFFGPIPNFKKTVQHRSQLRPPCRAAWPLDLDPA